MQYKKPFVQSIVSSEPKLLIAISTAVVVLLSIPVILPHINHPSMIYHIILHIVSLIIAIFLTAISTLAYKRSESIRIFFITLGFFSLTVVELMYLFHATEDIEEVALPLVHIELPHINLLAMLTLFRIGILKM